MPSAAVRYQRFVEQRPLAQGYTTAALRRGAGVSITVIV